MSDTGILLKEATLGCRYAKESIGIAKDYAEDRGLILALKKYAGAHDELEKRLRKQIKLQGEHEPQHQSISSAMTKMHISMSLSMNPSSSNIAKLMISNCSAGMKNLSKLKNRHPFAEPESICLTNELIRTERDMIDDMLRYIK